MLGRGVVSALQHLNRTIPHNLFLDFCLVLQLSSFSKHAT